MGRAEVAAILEVTREGPGLLSLSGVDNAQEFRSAIECVVGFIVGNAEYTKAQQLAAAELLSVLRESNRPFPRAA